MPDHPVPHLKAAVELAESWRRAGTHRWFRGQNRLWPIATSLARRQGDPEEHARCRDRIRQFSGWLGSVPELRHLLAEEHVHAFFGILQHYGVPTHYVDFTIDPKVAGYFAGVGPGAEPGQYGCILALDPDDWVRRLRTVAAVKGWPASAWPEKVVVEVPNLWRLAAQSGFFVYLPIERAEGYEPVDRIVFPHNGSGFELSEKDVYPARKSPLEERLDEFFTEELMLGNQEFLRERARAWKMSWLHFERPGSSRWLRPGAGAHESWRSLAEGWSAYVREEYGDPRERTAARLPVAPEEPLGRREELQAVVRHLLDESPGARREAIDWKIVPTPPGVPPRWVDFVERAVRRTWDGVRRLPFTDDQVAESVAMTVVLACADVSEAPSFSARDFSKLLGPVLHMELANARDVTARGAMAESTYQHALRPDLEDVIVPELLHRPRHQLRQVLAPAHLFRFDRLVDAFARELIPTQVLVQSHDLAVFFSPARTAVIGAA